VASHFDLKVSAILILTGVISTVMSIPYLLDAIQDAMGVLPVPVSVLSGAAALAFAIYARIAGFGHAIL